MDMASRFHRVFRPSDTKASVESRALYFAAGVSIVSLIAAFFYFLIWNQGAVEIFGRGSIGAAAIILSTIATFIGYFYAASQIRQIPKQATLQEKVHRIVTTAALAFIHASIALWLTTVSFYVVDNAFKGLELDYYASSAIVTATVTVCAYAMYLLGVRVSTVNISSALAVFLVAGVLISMITADDPYWWTAHLSLLGASSGVSAWAFDMTLIIGGIVMVCLADFLADDLTALQKHNHTYKKIRVRAIQVVLSIVGVLLAFVGLFPFDTHLLIHNSSATGMLILFIAFILGLRWFIPNVTRIFMVFSYVVVAILVTCAWLYLFVQYMNLTALEIVSFAVVFSWLVVFVRQIAAVLHDTVAVRKKPAKNHML